MEPIRPFRGSEITAVPFLTTHKRPPLLDKQELGRFVHQSKILKIWNSTDG